MCVIGGCTSHAGVAHRTLRVIPLPDTARLLAIMKTYTAPPQCRSERAARTARLSYLMARRQAHAAHARAPALARLGWGRGGRHRASVSNIFPYSWYFFFFFFLLYWFQFLAVTSYVGWARLGLTSCHSSVVSKVVLTRLGCLGLQCHTALGDELHWRKATSELGPWDTPGCGKIRFCRNGWKPGTQT